MSGWPEAPTEVAAAAGEGSWNMGDTWREVAAEDGTVTLPGVPDTARVFIDGAPYDMTLRSGDPETGALYRYETALAELETILGRGPSLDLAGDMR